MAHVSGLIAEDIEQYLRAHERKGLLRFITCGSVDDGKSTLIGRLLFESKMLFEDQLAALEADSKKVGTQGGELDFALLVDGLSAEREQGITIDVAYRFFSTDRRKFIVADTPGHEQYTRNMVTGASTADVAVVMIDARKGVLTQTRRHSFIVSLLGIRKVVLAINKLDMVGYAREVFEQIEADYRAFATKVGLSDITCIPMSALRGDNITERSGNTPWYEGPTLMGYLEAVEVDDDVQRGSFRMPVQWVNRPNLDFRGFSGRIVGGSVKPGDRIKVLPAGTESQIARIVTLGGDLDEAIAGQSVTLTLTDEIDASRGDVIVAAEAPASLGDRIEATMVWMSEEPLAPGRPYLLKSGARTAAVTLDAPRYKTNVNTLEQLPTATLSLNEIGVCDISLDRPIAFDPYASNRDMGGFILIDRLSNNTIAAGLIRGGQRRTAAASWATLIVDAAARAAQKTQQARVVLLESDDPASATQAGLLLEKLLFAQGRHSYVVNAQLASRFGGATHELALAMRDAGLVVIMSASLDAAQRMNLRERLAGDDLVEVALSAGKADADVPSALEQVALQIADRLLSTRGSLPGQLGLAVLPRERLDKCNARSPPCVCRACRVDPSVRGTSKRKGNIIMTTQPLAPSSPLRHPESEPQPCCQARSAAESEPEGSQTEGAAPMRMSEGAVLRILMDNRPAFLRFVEKRVGSAALAEDILQDALARSVKAAGALRSSDAAIGWFYRVLGNAIIDNARRSRTAKKALGELEAESSTLADEQPSTASACQCVSRVAADLRPQYASALQRIEVDGLSIHEFASEQGISAGNAAVRAFRAREALRRDVLAHCGACAEAGCASCSCDER